MPGDAGGAAGVGGDSGVWVLDQFTRRPSMNRDFADLPADLDFALPG